MPFPSPGDLPDPGIESASPALAGGFFTTEPSRKPLTRKEYNTDRGIRGGTEFEGGYGQNFHCMVTVVGCSEGVGKYIETGLRNSSRPDEKFGLM